MLSSVSLRSAQILRSVAIPSFEGVANHYHRSFSSPVTWDDDDDDDVPSFPDTLHRAGNPKNNNKGDELEKRLRPTEIVKQLDSYIVGQQDAKRAVAIALRNRWRRKQLNEDLQKEIMPRNVLMVGPTGCGKTEVARRMATMNDAPFIKVEATKFTEVGYHGRDVDKIITDLLDVSIQLTRKKKTEEFKKVAEGKVEDAILQLITSPVSQEEGVNVSQPGHYLRELLRQGVLEDQEVEIMVPKANSNAGQGANGNGNPNIMSVMMAGGQAPTQPIMEKKILPISKAREVILNKELERLLSDVDLVQEAITAAEESGIVFIDEIDKICTSSNAFGKSADASAEGVQRDLLPLVEGTTIETKHGNVKTDYILFVASGAFHAVRPSDMLPELQGRFPVRVELKGLTEEDMYKILTEPVANMIRQQIELLATEGIEVTFADEAIREVARVAALLNKTVENIGARRLHTVMERIMEEISYDAADLEKGSKLVVTKEVVDERLQNVIIEQDLSKFIL